MADEQYAEIKEKFGGTWKVDRSEHFEEFLREAGVNIVIRKIAGLAKPTSEITVEDGKVSISSIEKCDTFLLREEYDTEFQGQKVKIDSIRPFNTKGLNVVIRKMAGLAKPTSKITVEDGKVSISLNAGFMKKCDTFQLGEEYDTEFQGQKVKGKASYTDGILTIDNNPVDTNVKPTKATRQITEDGELLLIIHIGDVVCKRWFKRVPA